MSMGTGAFKVGRGQSTSDNSGRYPWNDPEYINYDMLGEKRYAHTKGGVMGTSKYPKTNPKNYRMTKNSARRQPELHGHGSLAALEKL